MSIAAAALATALTFSPVNATPPPTYFLGGTDFAGTGTVTEADINWLLAGNLTGAQNVPYPRSGTGMDASIDVGAGAIVDIINNIPDDTGGPVRIAGVSQGALAIAEAKRRIMALDEDERPGDDDVVFVAIGDPSGPTGIGSRLPGLHIPYVGVTFRPAPETPYDTIIVTREYDGLADFPDRPLNIFSTLNAIAGVVYVHPISYGPDTDLDAIPDADVTESVNSLGGKTTTYFIQNDRLPLLQPLRDLNVDERFVSAIEHPLKQLVDAGYSRNDAGPAVVTKTDDTKTEDTQTADTVTERSAAKPPTSQDRTGYKLSLRRNLGDNRDADSDTNPNRKSDKADDRASESEAAADSSDKSTDSSTGSRNSESADNKKSSDDAQKAA
jgi:hypothetical protein